MSADALNHALLLQGPVGPFFRRFADELLAAGVSVTKVNFNSGDDLFFRGPEVVRYREPMGAWHATCERLVDDRGIDGVFLFGDCRPMHRDAMAVARRRGIPVWVFEEGYLRPDFVTMERGGVNGNSSVPKDPDFFRRAADGLPDAVDPERVGNTFPHHALWTTMHSVAATTLRWRYPHYRHHRDINSARQAAAWFRGFARKLWYSVTERELLDELTEVWSGRYFLVPLQVYCDAQLSHSRFESMDEFIEYVVSVFAARAPDDHRLVLKHHPHDRAYRDYARLIATLGERYGCGDRLVYVHDLHLPTMLKHARGVITMNSTVGTSSLHHGTPVKVLGSAVYDIPELTYQGDLEDFLRDPGTVDRELYLAFVRWLREANQINGSFYRRLATSATAAGLVRPVFEADSAGDDDHPVADGLAGAVAPDA